MDFKNPIVTIQMLCCSRTRLLFYHCSSCRIYYKLVWDHCETSNKPILYASFSDPIFMV